MIIFVSWLILAMALGALFGPMVFGVVVFQMIVLGLVINTCRGEEEKRDV